MALVALATAVGTASGQETLTLERCHALAVGANHDLRMAEERLAAAEALRKMAVSEFFPKLSANGTAAWNEKSLQLLSDAQQAELGSMGSIAELGLKANMNSTLAQLAQTDPALAQSTSQVLQAMMSQSNLAGTLNGVGQSVADALNFDLRNVYAGSVTLSQPVYLGGKLRALYQAARCTSEAAEIACEGKREELLIAVDEAYWRIVSLKHKVELAQQYSDLLQKMCADVEAMVDAEVATESDASKVRVRLNEAQMSLTKATCGLALSKMALYELCGLDLNADYELEEEPFPAGAAALGQVDMHEVWTHRRELKLLSLNEGIAKSGERLALSGLLPNVALTGSYLVTNPNLFNGFQKSWGGMFNVGVAVNIPLCHASDIYALKAARHKRAEAHLKVEQARNKIQIQVNKLNYELDVANEKLVRAKSALGNAEENLRLAQESFGEGVVSSNDLLAAQTAWLSAKGEVIDAEIEIRMDYLYLQQALGRGGE